MMVFIKNKIAIEKMRKAGQLLAKIMQEVKDLVIEGVNTLEIDSFIEQRMKMVGLIPSCKGYGGYKYASCISLNDVVIHGAPSKDLILKSGDFVKIDVVGAYGGYCADMTRCFFVGQVSQEVKKIAQVAQSALDKAIEKAEIGNKISDLSAIIQDEVEKNSFGVIRRFAGHGIGKKIHEDPDIPNFRIPGKNVVLQEGMTLAIEPMITQGSFEIKIMNDGWTVKTIDGKLAAHVEDTILITKNGPEIFTRL
jgi:methionyl aminopeptidase